MRAQLLLTLIVCSGVHILFTWGTLSNWNDHGVIQICAFRWAHPGGYHALPTSLIEAMPLDAFMTAFFTCLGASAWTRDRTRAGSMTHC